MDITKKKIAITHPKLGRGGSEARVMWLMETLKHDYDVSLISTNNFDLSALNAFYGTTLNAKDFVYLKVKMPNCLRNLSSFAALRGAFYQRYCRQVAPQFDLLISAYNFCDFGVPAIQCLADFSWDEEIRRKYDPVPSGAQELFHNIRWVRDLYLRLVKAVSPPSGRNLFSGKDVLLANSRWTASIIHEKYGVDVEVVYPEVLASFPREFPEKKFGFVCIGRISPEKRIERIIEILRKVRQRGHEFDLHVIGGTEESEYGRYVEKISAAESEWVKLEGCCFGEKKEQLLSGHLFGIHAREGEAFGISVAEMVKAGCITFVHRDGGQAEIVNHEMLIYENIEDAIDKIDFVLNNVELQQRLRAHLAEQAKLYSTKNTMFKMKNVINKFIGI